MTPMVFWYILVGKLVDLLAVLTFLAWTAFVVTFLFARYAYRQIANGHQDEEDDPYRVARRWEIPLGLIALFFTLLAILVPSRSDVILIGVVRSLDRYNATRSGTALSPDGVLGLIDTILGKIQVLLEKIR